MSNEQNQEKKNHKSEPKKYQRPTLTKYPALKQIMGSSGPEGAGPGLSAEHE